MSITGVSINLIEIHMLYPIGDHMSILNACCRTIVLEGIHSNYLLVFLNEHFPHLPTIVVHGMLQTK